MFWGWSFASYPTSVQSDPGLHCIDVGYDGDPVEEPCTPGSIRSMLAFVSLPLSTRAGVVLPVRADAQGLTGPKPSRTRGPSWRRVAPGHYVPVGTDSSVLDQRIIEAMAGTPSDAAVTGWAALGWRRARWFTGLAADGRTPLDVPVALHELRGMRRRRGVEISEDWLRPYDVELVDGLRVTVPERAVAYEACRARSLIAAVRTVDLAAAADLVDLESLASYAATLGPRPGIRRFRQAIGAGDENVWSPQEVAMRLTWLEHRGARLLTNCPIFDLHGRHLVTPDLLDARWGVVGEYNGVVHLEETPFRKDLDREELYRDLGVEVVTMMSASRPDADSFLARLDGAYARAERGLGRGRAWTIEQPEWWVDTSTVARRRALTGVDRDLWLRRRAG